MNEKSKKYKLTHTSGAMVVIETDTMHKGILKSFAIDYFGQLRDGFKKLRRNTSNRFYYIKLYSFAWSALNQGKVKIGKADLPPAYFYKGNFEERDIKIEEVL